MKTKIEWKRYDVQWMNNQWQPLAFLLGPAVCKAKEAWLTDVGRWAVCAWRDYHYEGDDVPTIWVFVCGTVVDMFNMKVMVKTEEIESLYSILKKGKSNSVNRLTNGTSTYEKIFMVDSLSLPHDECNDTSFENL